MTYVRSNNNVGYVELTQAELACEQDDFRNKINKFTGYFHLNNNKYYLSKKFDSCEDFINLVRDKSISANYLKGNNLIIDFYINDDAYYESSFNESLLITIFLSFLCWVFLRIPIKWLIRKYA